MPKLYIKVMMMFLLYSCNLSHEHTDITRYCEFPNDFPGACFFHNNDVYSEGVVVKNQEEYQAFGETIQLPILDCDEAELPPIDFDQFTLLAIYTAGGGCNANYKRTIIEDQSTRKIYYEIKVVYEGYCDMYISSMNYVLIPRLKNDYDVVFEMK